VDEATKTMVKNSLLEAVKRARLQRISECQTNLQSFLNDSARRMATAMDYLAHAHTERQKIDQLKGQDGIDPWIEIEKVLENPFWEFLGITGQILKIKTRNKVVLVENNPKSGIKREVCMGTYQVQFEVSNARVRVFGLQATTEVAGHYHPYISNLGDICWGNASETAAKCLVDGNYSQYFQLLATLLSNYHPDTTPYIRLVDFAIAQGIEKRPTSNRVWCEDHDEQRDSCPCGEWCAVCDRSHDDCACYYCDTCGESYRRRCEDHWCSICETYDREDCGCCQDCGNTQDNCNYCGECDLHECICCNECSGTTEEHESTCVLHASNQTEESTF
jgi:hypothetical protein